MLDVAGRIPRWPELLRVPGPDDVRFRRGLERVLHDEVAMGLSAAVLQLDLISAGCDEPPLAARIDLTRQAVCHVIEDVRRLGRMVFSPVLSGDGLAHALHAAAEHRRLRLRLDLPAHGLGLAAQARVGLLLVDRLHTLMPDTGVWVRVRGRRFVRVRITENRPGRRERRYWAVAACG